MLEFAVKSPEVESPKATLMGDGTVMIEVFYINCVQEIKLSVKDAEHLSESLLEVLS